MGDLKSGSIFDNFLHTYPTGNLTFTKSNGFVFTFNSGGTPLDEFSITLPVGDYIVSGEGGDSPTWAPMTAMSLAINSQSISVTESTTQIDITATPTCTCIVVADENSVVNKVFIDLERDPLFSQDIFWYCYLYPSKPVRILRNNGELLSLETVDWLFGYIYKIRVTDAPQQPFNINPGFLEGDSIVW